MRNRLHFFFALLALVCLAGHEAGAVSAKDATGAVFAASDGRGEIRLIWFPPLGKWPAGGWQIQDGSGKVVIEQVQAEEAQFMDRLAEQDRASITRLMPALRRVASGQDAALLYGMIGARAFGDWNYAQAVGLARALPGVPAGQRSYRLVGLGAGGKPSGASLASPPVDAGVATPLPPAPQMLRAEAVEGGVALYWQPAPSDRERPTLAYQVERNGESATREPVVMARAWSAMKPAMVDHDAPLETEIQYRVRAVDVFGHAGAAAETRVYAADLAALQPPFDFSARAGKAEVALSWTPNRNPHTAGYVVERSFLPQGPFEAVTPDGLAARDGSYTDRKLSPGTAYVYRLRAMGPRGDLGPPSRSAVAQPEATSAPGAVDGLKAEVGRTRVRLSWTPLGEAVAGYFVERLGKDGTGWMRLTPRPVPEPFYEDYAIAVNGGQVRYRVVAVGFDSKLGRASELAVKLPDLAPLAPPFISAIDGADGKVQLNFAPGDPGRTTQFLVLRGDDPRPEVVLGDPLPGNARQYVDGYVEPGKSYWYRLVAVDGQGNRSDPGAAVVVWVGSPEVPAAAKPSVTFEADPFPHAVVRFAEPPQGLGVQLQYRKQGGQWLVLAGPLGSGGETTQANLPEGGIEYRSVYVAADGREGPPSEAVALKRP